ncbi:MAG TPA: TonB family protein [Thermoanaerobaculia bacterium]|jgi:TonB family protein|nr:TonB family protein [Thermoanaerobaculia bacterium]
MAARNKPYEQFGPYILFKKLEQDSLGDLWRAGRIEDAQLGATVALRRILGGNRGALASSITAASPSLSRLAGTSFARDQVAGVVDGVPFLAWDYAGGRSLRHIIDRGRGGKDTQPNPLPIDQAIVIAEKVALSLATTAEMRDGTNNRLSHGALLPQFIWISDDGEIRVGGQLLASGIIESLVDPKVAADIGRYVAPEIRTPGQVPKSADVYSMGAILFLLVTGHEPPDAMTASAFVSAVRAAKTPMGAPVPDDIRVILDKSFNLDPSMRYASIAEMKQAVSTLAHGGKYSATTFNLAFYLSNLLKKEMESEAAERDKESKLNVAPYLEVPAPAPAAAAPAPTPLPAMFAEHESAAKPKSKLPLAIAAAVVLAAAGVGGWMLMGRTSAKPAPVPAKAAMVPAQAPAPRVISEPILVAGGATSTGPATATTGSADPEAQKKAFEDAVREKMQAEMMKLQSDYMDELKKQQSRNAPVAAAPAPSSPAPAPAEERASLTPAQLTQQMRETRTEETATAPAPVQQTQTAVATAPAPTVAAPAPAPVTPTIREGDVVDVGALDVMPRPVRAITAVYPPIARQQRISATVVVSALIDENGEVSQVKVLRGVGRFGIDEAAQRAMKSARFTSPMKAGKRVKTWYPQTIEFRP